MIHKEFGYGYIPEYHYDIVNLEEYYIKPKRNNFFLAVHQETKKLIGTIGIRSYDKDFSNFRGLYAPENVASIWRVFVSKKWRRNGVASSLVRIGEEYCLKKVYQKIYLHTHKSIPGSMDFWLSNNYQIIEDTDNHLQTVHMEKSLGYNEDNYDKI
ncbi:MAG: GNAT family N-acetyltransferase [Methanobacteriaceae archaeon]|nr:GNAT family N-acetyltransferase [Methanobacteriaceae archaeon]